MSPRQAPSIPSIFAHVISPQRTFVPVKCPWPWYRKYHEHFLRKCMLKHLVLLRLGEMRAWKQRSYSVRFFGATLGQPETPVSGHTHRESGHVPWFPAFFSSADSPFQQLPRMAARILLCEKMTPCSGPLKSVPRLFLTLPTSWLGLCTAPKYQEAKPILSNSLTGVASQPVFHSEPALRSQNPDTSKFLWLWLRDS